MSLSTFVFVGILVCIGLRNSDATSRCKSVDVKSTGGVRNDISETDHLPRCVTPIENLLNGRSRSGIGNGFEANPPPWFNATLATLGQRFAKKHWFSTNMATIFGGTAVLTPNDTSQSIYYSGANHLRNALQSATAFLLQGSVWYEENLFSSRPNLFKSLSKVRTIHYTVLNNFKRNATSHSDNPYKIDPELWTAWENDLKESTLVYRTVPPLGRGTPEFRINQYALATVLWGLASLPLIRSESFGIPLNAGTDEELEGFLHFWAFVGYSLGVEDEFNICLQPNVRTARVYFERFLHENLAPQMFDMSYETKALLEQTIKGYATVVGPIAQFDFTLRRVLEDIVGIPCPNIKKKMTPMGRILDSFWRRALIPAVRRSKSMRSVATFLTNGYVQNLSLKMFGYDGTNKAIVADKCFTNFIFEL